MEVLGKLVVVTAGANTDSDVASGTGGMTSAPIRQIERSVVATSIFMSTLLILGTTSKTIVKQMPLYENRGLGLYIPRVVMEAPLLLPPVPTLQMSGSSDLWLNGKRGSHVARKKNTEWEESEKETKWTTALILIELFSAAVSGGGQI